MGSHDNEDMSFQNRKQTSSRSIATDPFFSSGWDNPLVSLSQSDNFGGGSSVVVAASQSEFTNPSHYPIDIEAQGMSSTSHLVQYQSDSSYVEMAPKLQCFGGSGSFSEMVGSFGLPECAGMSNPGCVANYNPNRDMGIDRASAMGANERDDRNVTDEGALGASPNGKRRKRVNESSPNKNAEGELNKDVSGESCEYRKEQDEKKIDLDESAAANVRGKQAGKQSKDTSQSGDAVKDSYIHVRARRGQATNSHSLAERVRREKISERMRLLQELVPGCNKITGKAVMLDEIINYVQSLQQQVEFLSMKLATVNPEVNADIERILSKDIMNSRNGGGAILGFTPVMNPSHPYPHGMYHGTLPNMQSSAPQFPSIPQTVMDNELHGLFHMGFDSSSNIDSLGQNASRLKPEL